MYDIIIIGAGPAGLTAAIYALRANKKVLVLEAKTYGGQIVNASNIENYPGIKSISGFDFSTNLYNQVKDLGGEIKIETVININDKKEVTTNKDKYNTKAIIIATGSNNRKLNIDKEEDFIGKGVSYCATCDGAFYKDKDVMVVGGGNTALEDSLYLSNIVNKVYLVHRRDEFRGESKFVEEIKTKDNIELVLNSTIKSINGIDTLESIDVIDKENNIRNIKVNGLFIAIGQEPKNEIFKNIINIDSNGYIETNDGVHTNIDGIYVAGDCRNKDLRQLTTAVSDGSIAATTAINEMK
ncbi:MAG: thioredoxin-disulfide reductase [Bacilli bacterium]|nr:thioredoxin-disulfide reductase [Bacilli bacterium]MBR3049218.1 thioredoxin-disulfide reductase [Bacilli bacterium]